MSNMVTCTKCDGRGKLRAFGHIENGKCFLCAGSGKLDASKVKATTQNLSPETLAAYLADKRATYLRHYKTVAARIPGLTLAQFQDMVRPLAEEVQAEDRMPELNAHCWANGAGYLAMDLDR